MSRKLKSVLPGYEELLAQVQLELGPTRRPLLIAIDGPDGVGKSSLASWLAWQLEMPSLNLDLYLVRDSKPLQWRTDDLERAIHSRLDLSRPVIIEGVLLLMSWRKSGARLTSWFTSSTRMQMKIRTHLIYANL